MVALAFSLTNYVHGPLTRDLDPVDRAIMIAEKIDDVSAMEERIEELESELEDHEQLEDELKTLEKERDELQEECDEHEKEKDKIDELLADARIEIERLTAERDARPAMAHAVDEGALQDALCTAADLRTALADLLAAIDAARLGKVARVGSLVIVETSERTMGEMGGTLGGAIAKARELIA